MKTKCLIVDDEPLACRVIESHISKIPSLVVVAVCNNAVQALDVMLKNTVDLIFLDIEMPEIRGTDLIKSVKKMPAIIFTTAYRDFALEAYELDAIDYLLKPISFERFLKAISKYFLSKGNEGVMLKYENPAGHSEDSFIYVRSDRKVMKVFVRNIRFIESMKDYIKIHSGKDVIITKEKISHLEDKLPDDRFLRIHRSFLVSVNHITAFTSETMEVDGQELPIGRTYKSSVLGYLGYKE